MSPSRIPGSIRQRIVATLLLLVAVTLVVLLALQSHHRTVTVPEDVSIGMVDIGSTVPSTDIVPSYDATPSILVRDFVSLHGGGALWWWPNLRGQTPRWWTPGPNAGPAIVKITSPNYSSNLSPPIPLSEWSGILNDGRIAVGDGVESTLIRNLMIVIGVAVTDDSHLQPWLKDFVPDGLTIDLATMLQASLLISLELKSGIPGFLDYFESELLRLRPSLEVWLEPLIRFIRSIKSRLNRSNPSVTDTLS